MHGARAPNFLKLKEMCALRTVGAEAAPFTGGLSPGSLGEVLGSEG
jgi:hypothetical protein